MKVMTPRARLVVQFAGLSAANAAAVAALYWNQALVQSIAADFPRNGLLWAIPTMPLAGYAAGVALLAFGPVSRERVSIGHQLGLLALALVMAGIAPNLPALAGASFLVGGGAAVAQRLIATAGRLGGPEASGIAIGTVLAAALTAILAVRLAGDTFAQAAGWRAVLMFAAVCVAASAVTGVLTRATAPGPNPAPAGGAVRALWRATPLFRRATLQQAALFAAYNAAWMTALVEVPPAERSLVVLGGCGAGLVAALAGGRLADRLRRRDLPRAGAASMLVGAAILLPAAYCAAPGPARVLLLIPGMALLDAGLQVALVANQARVQALMPAARTRLAAILTVSGSLGGGAGAGAAYWLWQHAGWQAAIACAAAAALAGLACSLLGRADEKSSQNQRGIVRGGPSSAMPARADTRPA